MLFEDEHGVVVGQSFERHPQAEVYDGAGREGAATNFDGGPKAGCYGSDSDRLDQAAESRRRCRT
ncbi:MAG: hypothetical protein ACKVI3_03270, partial [Verrucomicrobiia bacterium]